VPYVRQGERSRPAAQVISEVQGREKEGLKEVVLTGTRIGIYNHDELNFEGLLERLLSETSIQRFRLSSLQPREIDTGLLDLFKDERLCPHFHLSLQSGSDTVLKRMKRCYGIDEYRAAVARIKLTVPEVAITTDVIVGFPGETEEEFLESYLFCKEMEFAAIHVFSYSKRPGTESSKMDGQVPDKVKKERSLQMLTLAGESARSYREKFNGRVMPVLWEVRTPDGSWSGYTGNYLKVYKDSKYDFGNRIIPTRVR
jgi:threonylcarbamoyladenosine tRNA methylthiotransferase MtaB